jgi:hypothetical protein
MHQSLFDQHPGPLVERAGVLSPKTVVYALAMGGLALALSLIALLAALLR